MNTNASNNPNSEDFNNFYYYDDSEYDDSVCDDSEYDFPKTSENEIEEELDDVNNKSDKEMNDFFDEMEPEIKKERIRHIAAKILKIICEHFAEILFVSKFVIIDTTGYKLEYINSRHVLVPISGNENITDNVLAMVYDYCKKHKNPENPKISITEEETAVINEFQKEYLGTENFGDIIEKLETAFREHVVTKNR